MGKCEKVWCDLLCLGINEVFYKMLARTWCKVKQFCKMTAHLLGGVNTKCFRKSTPGWGADFCAYY